MNAGAGSSGDSDISTLRSREDRRALCSVSRRIHVTSLGLLDAPLRLGVELGSICKEESTRLRSPEETAELARHIRRNVGTSLVLAPLALGNHVDHIAVLDSALSHRRSAHLAFYEDLPYATWTGEDQIQFRVRQIEQQTQVNLKPIVLTSHTNQFSKRRACSRYGTQISREEAAVMAAYTRKYGTGERLWVPRFSRSWNELTL